jgi:putative nucleotidyltransferase with HDIG domain
MEGYLLRELIRRGIAVSQSAASPAAFSILSGDRLALDHLAAKIQQSQEDVSYLAIVDGRRRILAHNVMGEAGKEFRPGGGEPVYQGEGLTVHAVRRDDGDYFEFCTPVEFSGKRVGEIFLGIGGDSLRAARREASRKLLAVAAAALLPGLCGAALLGGIITRPIKQLSGGVARLKSGSLEGAVAVTTRDELGALTADFNDMAKELARQRSRLAQNAREIEEAYVSTVRILAAAIDARDEYTLGHSTRVANLALAVGRRLGLAEEELRELAIACFLHDVGKIRIPDRILNKKGPLDAAERALMVHHPRHGADILRLAESLHRYVPAILYHHERHDGSGYPEGLRGDEIPRFAAIVAIADAYDAMTPSRPYRPGLSRDEAVAELRHCSGSQFAPELVEAFVAAMDENYEEDMVPAVLARRAAG